MPTRYKDGSVSIELDDGLDEFARSLLSVAERETVAVLERYAKSVADEASRKWYQQVDKQTGKAGAIDVFTTLDGAKGEVRVTIGTTDTRMEGRRPTPTMVRRPGPLSQITKKGVKGRIPNPKASDGKFLMVELVRKPATAMIKAITPALGRAIAARAARGG